MSEQCKICERDTGGFEYCNEFCEIQGLRSQLEEAREDIESYKYDLETLVSVVSDCVNKMSMEECYDTLKEVVDHYEKQKEQEPQPNLGGLVDEHCDLIKEQG